MIFYIPGLPVAQGRPKFARMGKGVRAYDPEKSRNWKAYVKAIAAQHSPKMMEGPLLVDLHFRFPRPKSVSAKKRPFHTVKPDCTNLAKGIEDALNGLLWADDSQVVDLRIRKDYGAEAGVLVKVEEL
jgi:Holliday junction resolvase RusA-like endonuclease